MRIPDGFVGQEGESVLAETYFRQGDELCTELKALEIRCFLLLASATVMRDGAGSCELAVLEILD